MDSLDPLFMFTLEPVSQWVGGRDLALNWARQLRAIAHPKLIKPQELPMLHFNCWPNVDLHIFWKYTKQYPNSLISSFAYKAHRVMENSLIVFCMLFEYFIVRLFKSKRSSFCFVFLKFFIQSAVVFHLPVHTSFSAAAPFHSFIKIFSSCSI